MTGDNAADAPSARPFENKRDLLAWVSALVTCGALLGAVRYCPSYENFKLTLFGAWISTFWKDLSTQIYSLFAGKPKGTMAAETVTSEWTYCLLVPFIVAWLVWYLWPKLRETPIRPHAAGYGILAVGFFLYVIGFLMENYYVGMGSMEFIYAGLIVLFLGWPIMRLLVFPWAFLMFMWPYDFMEDFATTLRQYMSGISHHLLQMIDVPNVLNGTAILSAPGSAHPFAIDIADPCSGIRSLFALVMIACLYAFIAIDKVWQQAVIIALAAPLVFLGNLVRIIILALGTIHFGEAFALGTNAEPSWFHEFAGYLVYAINFGGLILTGSLLIRFTSPPPDDSPTHPDAQK
jgi:exosortase